MSKGSMIGKTVPYLVLGFLSLIASVLMAIYLFKVPYRGGIPALFVAGGAFLLSALGQGFLISIVKELLVVLKDPKGRIILIVPPLIQAVIFSFAATLEVNNLSLAVNNLDNGKWGYELVQRLSSSS